jgi:hypothetical protein
MGISLNYNTNYFYIVIQSNILKPKNLFEKCKTKNMGFGSTYLPLKKVEPNNLFEKG